MLPRVRKKRRPQNRGLVNWGSFRLTGPQGQPLSFEAINGFLHARQRDTSRPAYCAFGATFRPGVLL